MKKMTSNTQVETIRIKELDLDTIQPSTATYKDPEQGGNKTIVVGKPGCFTAGTPVLMYDGSVKSVENVLKGEFIMGPDSKPRTVLELCRNRDEMFRIVPAKGDPYTVNLKHKLVLKSRGYYNIYSWSYNKGDIIEISVEEFLSKPKTFQSRWHVFRTGVEFPTQKVDLDPYILGLWLGNGNSAIENKHIPQNYKANDRKTRLELLAGIIDADGYYDIRGNSYDIVQKNETVIDDIVFIARSLGFSADKRLCVKSCMSNGNLVECDYFRTFISGNIDEIPCRILTKKAQPRQCKKDHLVSGFKIVSQGDRRRS
jgi:hypothetical protein